MPTKDSTISNEKFLTHSELTELFKLVKKYFKNDDYKNLRNYLILRLSYLHGLRISEALNLRWLDVNFDDGLITIRRLKRSMTANQIMTPDEIRDLKKLKKFNCSTILIFCNEDGTIMHRDTILKLCNKLSTGIDKKFTPHSLKHTCGVHLALTGKNIREIQHHLGHRDVKNTLVYLRYTPTGNANDLI